MEVESSLYIIEIYDSERKLLLSESIAWSNEPRFGMSYDDALLIYGKNGLLKSLIHKIEEA